MATLCKLAVLGKSPAQLGRFTQRFMAILEETVAFLGESMLAEEAGPAGGRDRPGHPVADGEALSVDVPVLTLGMYGGDLADDDEGDDESEEGAED